MPAPNPAGHGGWSLGRRTAPGLKELTIELGDSDVYVNMSRHVDLDNGHTLYEAILTDAHGSRSIYIDRDDIVECLQDAFIATPKPAGEPATDVRPDEPKKRIPERA